MLDGSDPSNIALFDTTGDPYVTSLQYRDMRVEMTQDTMTMEADLGPTYSVVSGSVRRTSTCTHAETRCLPYISA